MHAVECFHNRLEDIGSRLVLRSIFCPSTAFYFPIRTLFLPTVTFENISKDYKIADGFIWQVCCFYVDTPWSLGLDILLSCFCTVDTQNNFSKRLYLSWRFGLFIRYCIFILTVLQEFQVEPLLTKALNKVILPFTALICSPKINCLSHPYTFNNVVE